MHDYSESIEAARGDADALYRLATELSGVVRFLAASAPRTVRRSSLPSGVASGGDDTVPRATWLTPIVEVWEKEMGGIFPMGPALKPFSQLRKKGHTEHEIARRLGYYCRHMIRTNEIQFANPAKFAQTFKMWDGDALAFEDE